MTIVLQTKPGINGANTLSIPAQWSAKWFRSFISNSLQGGDVRNAVGTNGIKVSGTIASPYATISLGGTGVPIIIPGGPVGSATVTINAPPVGTGSIALSLIGNGTQNVLGVTGGNSLSPIVIDGTSSTGYSIIFQDGATEYGGIGPGPRNVSGAPLASVCTWAFNGPVILGGFNGSYAALTTDATGAQAGVTITADAATALQVNGVPSFAPVTISCFAANTAGINFTNSFTVGTKTATFTPTNKPGTTTASNPAEWLAVQLNGTTYWIPCWAN